MRFFHLSDLHIGKHLHYYNLKEDQNHILGQVVKQAFELHPDAVVIAGDIYDKPSPSAEAVTIFNQFLTSLSEVTPAIPVLIISGNHDSAERLEYLSAILNRNHIHIAGLPPRRLEEFIRTVTLEDEYGKVCFYLLPFVKPGMVRNLIEDGEAKDITFHDAVRMLVEREKIDTSIRNVIISHQFYTSGRKEPDRSGSEMITVGGIDNVDIEVLAPFDYAALGHIHKAQKIENISRMYCGTLLKYSVSESRDEKVLKMVELGAKGEAVKIQDIPLVPLRDVRTEQGLFRDVLESAAKGNADDYVSITITDEVTPFHVRERLDEVYSHVLEVKADNTRTRTRLVREAEAVDISDPLGVFEDFFAKMQGRPMNGQEKEIIAGVIGQEE